LDPPTLAIQGTSFDEGWKVSVDKVYDINGNSLRLFGSTLLVVKPETKEADSKYKKLVLIPNGQDPVVLDIPPLTPPAPKASLDVQLPVPVAKGASPGVPLNGANLGLIKKVWSAAGKELFFQVSDDGKKIIVFLTAEVTKESGPAVVLLETSDGTRIPANLKVE
jgi:hypothetical protein